MCPWRSALILRGHINVPVACKELMLTSKDIFCTSLASFPGSTPQLLIAKWKKAGREPGTFRHATCVSAVT